MNPLPEGSIRSLLHKRHSALRRSLALRLGLRAAAFAAALVTLAFLVGLIAIPDVGAAWARLVLLTLAIAACTAFAVRLFLRRAPRFDGYLEGVEGHFPRIRSLLRNAVDFAGAAPTGTSQELAHAVTRKTADELASMPLGTLAPKLAPHRPLAAFAACFALVLAATFLAPRAVERSWATLWNPAAAAPPVTLAVEPGSVRVTPGASLTVIARVSGSERRPRIELPGAKPVAAVAEGRRGADHLWRFDLVQLTREQDYRVRVAQAESPTYHIALAGDPMPVSFEVEYRAPSYARLPVQRGSALRGDLSALRGTRAVIDVTFDRDLQQLAAAVPGSAPAPWKAVSARRWRGEITLDREGEYELQAVAASGAGRFRYRIQPLADAPPLIAVRTPEGDLDLPAGQQVPLEVLGQDDLGLSELRLEYRKSGATDWSTMPLANFPSRPRETEVRSRWDASSLGLLPGESAVFRFVLFDDAAVGGRNRAESPVFELRFPSLADLYDTIDQSQGKVQNTLEKVATQAKELQKSLDKLARQQPRPNPQASQPAYERAEELKSNLGRQQELAKQLDQAAQQLKETLEQASERQAFEEELQRKLREMSELMQKIQSEEFRSALEKMQQALENLDKRALENQLPQWQKENKEMLQNLERTLELLKKLREEERLESLAQRANELKQQQDELNRQHEQNQKDSGREGAEQRQKTGEQQEKAARETEELSKEVEQAAKENEAKDQQEQLEKTAQDLQQQGAEQQREAAQSAQKNQNQQAQKQGQQASEALDRASQQLRQSSQQSQQEQNSVNLAAVRRAAQDLVSLQRESEANLQNGPTGDDRANKQTDLSEGVARVADSLGVLANETPFLSPKLIESLGRAMNQLSQSGKDMGNGNRARGEQAGRDGSTALNHAILELRKSEASMCQQPGQGQGKQPGMSQQMSQLGDQQSQLNQRSRNLSKRLSQQMRLDAGDQSELQRMASEQQRLREQLEQIQKDDEARQKLLGRLDSAHREMQEVEEALRAGNTGGDLEEKQTRILSRLLDASRSVNRRDFDPQRESKPGEALAERSAATIPSSMLRESDRLRLDLLKADADRYPAQYRAFVEAYLRALNGPRR